MAPKDPKIEMLRGVPLFKGLKEAELARLAELADQVDLPAGRVLMRQGERGAEMFVIASGSAVVERDGREIARRGSGTPLGEIAIISEGRGRPPSRLPSRAGCSSSGIVSSTP